MCKLSLYFTVNGNAIVNEWRKLQFQLRILHIVFFGDPTYTHRATHHKMKVWILWCSLSKMRGYALLLLRVPCLTAFRSYYIDWPHFFCNVTTNFVTVRRSFKNIRYKYHGYEPIGFHWMYSQQHTHVYVLQIGPLLLSGTVMNFKKKCVHGHASECSNNSNKWPNH